jgi:hypothetical protein
MCLLPAGKAAIKEDRVGFASPSRPLVVIFGTNWCGHDSARYLREPSLLSNRTCVILGFNAVEMEGALEKPCDARAHTGPNKFGKTLEERVS